MKLKKGDIIKITFFSRANGFKGSGERVLVGRCLGLKIRRKWTVLKFSTSFKYTKFFFSIPLSSPIISNLNILHSRYKIKFSETENVLNFLKNE